MRAVTWQAKGKVSVEEVKEPRIEEATDIIVKVELSALSSWDVHISRELEPFLKPGDTLGREALGSVVELGSDVNSLKVGDRVVVPSIVACGKCMLCLDGFQSQCETTQNYKKHLGAAIIGGSSLYGQLQGAQAEFLRVPEGQYGPIKVLPEENAQRLIYLSNSLPTAWQALEYSQVEAKGSLAIIGMGTLGLLVLKLALFKNVDNIIVVDGDPRRRAKAESLGAKVVDPLSTNAITAVREMTYGRGADAVIDTMEASPSRKIRATLNPNVLQSMTEMKTLSALASIRRGQGDALGYALRMVRRGGVLSLAGTFPPIFEILPSFYMFDHQISLRMGQPNTQRWSEHLLALIRRPGDPLKLDEVDTISIMKLEDAPKAYSEADGHGFSKTLFQL